MNHPIDFLSSRGSDSRSTSTGSTSDDLQSLKENFNSSLSFGSNFGNEYECLDNDFVNGMIFVCDESTTVDMFKHQIFGLPIPYLREMKMLIPGRSALFLIEKQTSLIRGVFVPTCPAKKLINHNIWLRKDQCAFPSQIKFELHSSYPALPKNSELAPSYLRRMKIKGKFLDRHRVNQLIASLTQYKAQQSQMFNCNYNQHNPQGMMTPPMNYMNMPPISPLNSSMRSNSGFNQKNMGMKRSLFTREQQMFLERFMEQKRLLSSMGMLPSAGPSTAPNMMELMLLLQGQNNDFLLQYLMQNMCS